MITFSLSIFLVERPSASAMANKDLHIISGLDGQHLRTISVAEDTEIRDILMQLHQDGKGLVTLLHGV